MNVLSYARRNIVFKLLNLEVVSASRYKLSTVTTNSMTVPPVQRFKFQNSVLLLSASNELQIVRMKSKGKFKQQASSGTDQEDEDDDPSGEAVDKNSKVMKIDVTSLRLDAILKNALGIARNKIETMFYESKIRLNGYKIMKKSVSVKEGDEIDVIKGYNQNNQDFLVVARVEILGTTPQDESIRLKIRRCKSLIIENYPDKWKGST